jgi:hypothetical protein
MSDELVVLGPERSAGAALTAQRYEPTNITELMTWAKTVASSQFVPQSYRGRPEDIVIAAMRGAELGLSVAQSLDAFAVINGRASMWGDSLLGVCLSARTPSGEAVMVKHDEGVEKDENGVTVLGWCEVQRRGREPVRREFTRQQAAKAGLLNKQGPWQSYEDRMFVLRARAYALRDTFADVIKGITLAEEVIGETQPARADVVQLAPGVAEASRDAMLAVAQQAVASAEAPDAIEPVRRRSRVKKAEEIAEVVEAAVAREADESEPPARAEEPAEKAPANVDTRTGEIKSEWTWQDGFREFRALAEQMLGRKATQQDGNALKAQYLPASAHRTFMSLNCAEYDTLNSALRTVLDARDAENSQTTNDDDAVMEVEADPFRDP